MSTIERFVYLWFGCRSWAVVCPVFVTAKQLKAVAIGKFTPTHTYAYLLPNDVTHDQLRGWLHDMTVGALSAMGLRRREFVLQYLAPR